MKLFCSSLGLMLLVPPVEAKPCHHHHHHSRHYGQQSHLDHLIGNFGARVHVMIGQYLESSSTGKNLEEARKSARKSCEIDVSLLCDHVDSFGSTMDIAPPFTLPGGSLRHQFSPVALRSQPRMAFPESEPLGKLEPKESVTFPWLHSGDQFQSFLSDRDHYVMVNFCSSSCHFCHEVMSEWEALAEHVKDSSDIDVEVAYISCEPDSPQQSVCKMMNVIGTPTFYLFSPHGRSAVKYPNASGRSKNDFLNFLEDQTGHSFNEPETQLEPETEHSLSVDEYFSDAEIVDPFSETFSQTDVFRQTKNKERKYDISENIPSKVAQGYTAPPVDSDDDEIYGNLRIHAHHGLNKNTYSFKQLDADEEVAFVNSMSQIPKGSLLISDSRSEDEESLDSITPLDFELSYSEEERRVEQFLNDLSSESISNGHGRRLLDEWKPMHTHQLHMEPYQNMFLGFDSKRESCLWKHIHETSPVCHDSLVYLRHSYDNIEMMENQLESLIWNCFLAAWVILQICLFIGYFRFIKHRRLSIKERKNQHAINQRVLEAVHNNPEFKAQVESSLGHPLGEHSVEESNRPSMKRFCEIGLPRFAILMVVMVTSIMEPFIILSICGPVVLSISCYGLCCLKSKRNRNVEAGDAPSFMQYPAAVRISTTEHKHAQDKESHAYQAIPVVV